MGYKIITRHQFIADLVAAIGIVERSVATNFDSTTGAGFILTF